MNIKWRIADRILPTIIYWKFPNGCYKYTCWRHGFRYEIKAVKASHGSWGEDETCTKNL